MAVARESRWRIAAPEPIDVFVGLAVAAVAAVVSAATAVIASHQPSDPHLRTLGALGYLLIILGGLLLAFRRSAPTATFILTLGLAVAYQGLGYPGGPDPLSVALMIFSITAAGERQRALGFALLATVLIVGVRGVSLPHGLESPLLVTFPVEVVAALYAGALLATRTTRRLELAQRIAEEARVREHETKRRVDAERLRIARELHDVVAHNISLINVQATMGVHLMHEQPLEAEAALLAIKQVSKQALHELRRILNVLRQADDAEPTAPAPGVADLESLLIGANSAGQHVTLRIVGSTRPLPPTVDVAVFRIVQESLTNALRYAGSSRTCVTLQYARNSVAVDIHDDGAGVGSSIPQGSGHGIAGMRERAEAVGGTFTAAPLPRGGFAVRAHLPVPVLES